MVANAAGSADDKAEDCLRNAVQAESSEARAKYATRGLAKVGSDRTLEAMLLRQLYLSHMESERFEQACEVAKLAVELDVMPDVACQDLARAYLGLGRQREAVDELRRASRVGPASRRAFHLWTLGSLQYFQGDSAAAVVTLERALRWTTTARPLYEAQLYLAQLYCSQPDCSQPDSTQLDGTQLDGTQLDGTQLDGAELQRAQAPRDADDASQAAPRPSVSPVQMRRLAELQRALEAAPSGQGYGQLILGELAYAAGDGQTARLYLESFVARTSAGRLALRVGLRNELARAARLIAALDGQRRGPERDGAVE